MHAQSLHATSSYERSVDAARLRAAEEAERQSRLDLQLDLQLEEARAEVEERQRESTEPTFAEEAGLADLLSASARAVPEAAAEAYTYQEALASAAFRASAASADEMERELREAKAQLVAARKQSELARVSLGAMRLSGHGAHRPSAAAWHSPVRRSPSAFSPSLSPPYAGSFSPL